LPTTSAMTATRKPPVTSSSTRVPRLRGIPGQLTEVAEATAELTDQQPAEPNLLVTDAPDVLLTDASVKESTKTMPTATMTMTTTTTTTLLSSTDIADRGAGSFEVPIRVVRTLGFGILAGVLSMSIVFVVVGFIRSRQSQKMKRTVPSSNSLVSMASARELAQQQA